jgi:hypothetical protein
MRNLVPTSAQGTGKKKFGAKIQGEKKPENSGGKRAKKNPPDFSGGSGFTLGF